MNEYAKKLPTFKNYIKIFARKYFNDQLLIQLPLISLQNLSNLNLR